MQAEFKKKLWVSVGVIVLSFALFAAATWQLTGNISGRVANIAKKRMTLQEQVNLIQTLAQFKSVDAQATDYESKLSSILPGREQLLDFPKWLNAVADDRNVRISFAFQGDNPTAGTGLGAIAFRLSVSGNVQDITNFFADMETNKPRFIVQLGTMDISQSGSDYQVSVTGMVYYQN
jgi:hypothetical protein